MMRDEGQMSSDFQEYTLIALFSLAAHLAGGVAAERASLPAMARYYNQDEDTLNQVGVLLAWFPACPIACPDACRQEPVCCIALLEMCLLRKASTAV